MITLSTFEFYMATNDGKHLVVSKQDPLKREHLGRIQERMIESNDIPFLVPLEIEEHNTTIRLRYALDGLVPLSQAIDQQSKMDGKLLLEIFYHILRLIMESKSYMLHARGFVLHPSYIFMKKSIKHIQLIYLPVREVEGFHHESLQMLYLAENLLSSVKQTSEVSVFHDFLHQFKRQRESVLSLYEIKASVLSRLQSDKRMEDVVQPDKREMNEELTNQSSSIPTNEREHPMNQPEKNAQQIDSHRGNRQAKAEEAAQRRGLNTLSSRRQTYVYLAVLVCVALIWRFYLAYPSEGMLYLSTGLSLLCVSIAYMLQHVWRPSLNFQTVHRLFYTEKKNLLSPKHLFNRERSAKASSESNENRYAERQLADGKKKNEAKKEENYYERLSNQTTLLAAQYIPTMKTEWLQTALPHPNERPPYLLLKNGDIKKEIFVQHTPFSIGRDQKEVDLFLHQDTGVSKQHAQILRQSNGQYVLTDLHSRNGTSLNDQKVAPDQEYALKHLDRIQIAKNELIFHMAKDDIKRSQRKDDTDG